MGSFDPLAEIRYVAQSLKPEDRLIVDGEIWDEKLPWRAARTPSCAASSRPCWRASASAQPTARSASITRRDSRHEGLHLVTRYFHAARDLSATVASEEIGLERGERIGMNFQYVYTPDAFAGC